MPAVTLSNLLLYSAQAALLVGTLALALAALRPSAAFRLSACRAVLVVLLVLPFQGLVRDPRPQPAALAPLAGAGARAIDTATVRGDAGLPWGAIVAGVLVSGIALRLLWLGLGLARLSRLARGLSETATAEDVAELQTALGTRARVHFAPGVEQPVTFGLAPATVLLPLSLLDESLERRRAVLCHELLHVRRRDWAWVLVEEATLALFWFHPVVWWLVGELQLAREQVVDRLTVAATGARRVYMDALLSAADAPSAPPLLAGFLRRRHLARRLVALAEEVAMSRARLAAGGVLMAGVLVGSGAVALAAWPLVPAAQAPAAESAGDVRMKFQPAGPSIAATRAEIEFPSGLSQEMTAALFQLDAVVDASGGVTAVRLVSLSARNQTTGASLSATDIHTVERMITAGSTQTGGPPFNDAAALSRDLETLAKAATAALGQWRFHRPQAAPAIARVTVVFDVTLGRATFGPVQPLSGFPAPPTSTFASAPPPPGNALRVGGNIAAPTKLVNVPPIYPPAALEAKVQGIVVIGITIAPDGSVAEAWVERGIPLLDEAALEAVRQWRYQPTLMNGAPVPLRMVVTVNFTLSE